MLHLASTSFFFLIIGIFASVSLIGVGQALMVIPATYFAYEAFRKKHLKLPLSAWFLIAFIAIATLSLVFNNHELIQPGKNYGRLRYFFLGILSIFLFKIYVLEVSDKVKNFLISCGLVTIILIGFIAVYQYFFQGQARAKTLTDSLRYGYGIGMILPVLIAIALRKMLFAGLNRKLLLTAIVSGCITLYLTFTRGALLGLICAFPFVILFRDKKKGIWALLFGGTLVTFLGGFYLFGKGEIGNRFISSRNNSSDNIRYTQWEAAYRAWSEKPILGIGFSDFINQEQKIKIKYGIAHPDYKGHAHNIFLETLSGTGVLGLLAFLGWLVMWMYETSRSNSHIAGIFIPFQISLIVSGQFEVVLDANNVTMIFMMYALSVVLTKNSKFHA